MSIFTNRIIINLIRLYVFAALIITVFFSDPVTSIAAVLSLLAYQFLQWRSIRNYRLFSTYFVFFAVAILYDPITNPMIAALIALPVLFLVTHGLIDTAGYSSSGTSKYPRSLTRTGITLFVIALVSLLIGLFLGSFAFVIAGVMAILHLLGLSLISIIKLSGEAVAIERITQRILAGTTDEPAIDISSRSGVAGMLYVESPYKWLEILSPPINMRKGSGVLRLSITPQLAGPSEIILQAQVIDCWGLIQLRFSISPLQILVIPRARYAVWLAKRYLSATKPGTLPLISNVSTVRPQYGLRRGIEYYGSQLYQPGDELHSIDWKHSAKYNKMVTKEFIEFQGQPAVMLVNLTAVDDEEADRLAQNIIMTSLSLAQEQIPTVIAAYDHEDVRLVTTTLQPHLLVVRALEATREISIVDNPVRYLYPPDIGRLRANINRLLSFKSPASEKLSGLMKIEYESLVHGTADNPATEAIYKALNNANMQSTIVFVSGLNHDANAIAVNKFLMTNKGYATITV